MSNLNPEDYKNGEYVGGDAAVPASDVAVLAGETVNSADPSITVGPAKAIVAAIGGALVGGLTALSTALADNVVLPAEWTAVALAVVIGSGVVGGATYATRTTVKGN
jgi:hypothetical protein